MSKNSDLFHVTFLIVVRDLPTILQALGGSATLVSCTAALPSERVSVPSQRPKTRASRYKVKPTDGEMVLLKFMQDNGDREYHRSEFAPVLAAAGLSPTSSSAFMGTLMGKGYVTRVAEAKYRRTDKKF